MSGAFRPQAHSVRDVVHQHRPRANSPGDAMRQLDRRLARLENGIPEGISVADARLVHALRTDRFDAGHLDRLYEIIRLPLRAAALAGAAATRPVRRLILSAPNPPLLRFITLLAFLNDNEVPDSLSDLSMVLTISEQVKESNAYPPAPGWQRARRGLIHRLVDEFGLDELRAAVPSDPLGEKEEYFPRLSMQQVDRMVKLVEPILGVGPPDFPVLVWQDDQGNFWEGWLGWSAEDYRSVGLYP